MMKCTGLLILALMLGASFESVLCSLKRRTELYDNLLNHYNPNIRPTESNTARVDVNVDFNLVSLLDLDAVAQFFVLHGVIVLSWEDVSLKWNSSDYDEDSDIPVEQKRVWRPDVTVSNAVEKKHQLGFDELPLIVSPKGRVSWRPSDIFKLRCQIDVTYFPFDKQTCYVQLSTFVTRRIRFKSRSFDWKTTQENQMWQITGGEVSQETGSVKSSGVPSIEFKLFLQRRPEYHVMNLIVPVILLSFANIMVFLLPVESGEKASFSMTVLLSFVVFSSYAGSSLPVTSLRTSYMAIYISTLIGISCLILACNVFILNLYHRVGHYFVPSCMAFINCRSRTNSFKVTPGMGESSDTLEKTNHQQKTSYVRIQLRDAAKFMDVVFFLLFALIAVATHAVFISIMKNGETSPD